MMMMMMMMVYMLYLCVDKLSRLCIDVQSRHSESLQLNVNSPLYKKFAK